MATGKKPEKRIKRFVMLGSPNEGAELAEKLGDNPAFIAVFGIAGQQLGKRWEELKPTLTPPAILFRRFAATSVLARVQGQDRVGRTHVGAQFVVLVG